MNDEQLHRYSRQILLPEIDLDGQEKLLQAKALIVGLGGLGSPVAMYLAAAGIGSLVLCDHDVVDLSNLQRQIVHRTADVGRAKAESAAAALQALNPEVRAIPLTVRLEGERLLAAVRDADVVIDASDNFPVRYALNAACIVARTPLVSGSAVRLLGQVTTFRFDLSPAPCYHCLYPDQGDNEENCADAGVLAPLVGIIGSIQATETIKVLLNLGQTLQGRLLQVDARSMDWRSSRLKADPDCPICSSRSRQASPLEYRSLSR
ncbi:MAG: molybdopterin-synthase adenylyltransferase MoeB [Gammaproteobacteria bacterium]|jgi:molybdopterin/thiamine biosynthesis adenylyltransferase